MTNKFERPAVFLDRDGVINQERSYVHKLDDFILMPGVLEGARWLQATGFALVVVTNQAGIGRGLYSEADYQRLTVAMLDLFASEGIRIDGIYHCPHHPTEGVGSYRMECACRKPAPGMLMRAARELNLDIKSSVLIGDNITDIVAGRAAGVSRCILIGSRSSLADREQSLVDYYCGNLREAAEWIIKKR